MILAAFLIILVLNLSYGGSKILDDFVAGERAMAAVGMINLLGVNGLIAWMIYAALSTSTDL